MVLTHARASRLIVLEVASIAFAVLLSVATDAFLPFALILLLAITLLHTARSKSLAELFPNPAWAIVVLYVMSVVSLLVTTQPGITLIQVERLILGVLVYSAMIRSVRLVKIESSTISAVHYVLLIMFCLVLLSLLLAMASPYIVDWEGASKYSFLPKSLYTFFALKIGDAVNPNVMAGVLVLLTPLAFALVIYGSHLQSIAGIRFRRLIISVSILSAILSVSIVLLMQSRGAMMGLLVSLPLLLLLRWQKKWLALGLAIFIGLAFLYVATTRINSLHPAREYIESILGLGQRINIWATAVLLIQDFPLTGIGFGTFQTVTNLLYPMALIFREIPHAHNLFLQVAVDLGIPGLIAWLGILVNVIIACIMLIRSREPLLRAAGAGLLASNVALCVHGLTDAVTWGMVRTAPLVWALWGLAVGASLLCANSLQKTTQSSPEKSSPATTQI